MAQQRGSTYFELDNWDEVVNIVGEENMWNINEQFLKQQVEQGKSFYLTHDPSNATGYYAKEVDFLKNDGYIFEMFEDGWIAVK